MERCVEWIARRGVARWLRGQAPEGHWDVKWGDVGDRVGMVVEDGGALRCRGVGQPDPAQGGRASSPSGKKEPGCVRRFIVC